MQAFLLNNRDELIARCKAKVAERPRRAATTAQLANGIPLFLEQLTRTLQAEEDGEHDEGVLISGPAGGDAGLYLKLECQPGRMASNFCNLAIRLTRWFTTMAICVRR
jgi:hypothetical protein